MKKVKKLKPGLQHYAWGGTTYIPTWLGIENKTHKPYAEAWYGDHTIGPASIDVENTSISLDQWIASSPEELLGKEAMDSYGNKMPYLLKILDVKDMLSLQLHPTKEAAIKGFQFENEQGIPLNASNRNYKDQNHKPEILYALSDFWMLQGFENLQTIRQRFEVLLPEFIFPSVVDWYTMMHSIMSLDEKVYVDFLSLIDGRIPAQDLTNKEDIFHWVHKAMLTYPFSPGSVDRGILVMLLMHVQYLKPGQVGYQAPGVLHAYLEGQNIELMANSDNVLRGGLTTKHIDPQELLAHLDTSEAGQSLLAPIYLMDDEVAYTAPIPDFLLKNFRLHQGTRKDIQFTSVSILLVRSGEISVNGIKAHRGESILIPAYTPALVLCESMASEIFLATA